jgi:hypothetical protein
MKSDNFFEMIRLEAHSLNRNWEGTVVQLPLHIGAEVCGLVDAKLHDQCAVELTWTSANLRVTEKIEFQRTGPSGRIIAVRCPRCIGVRKNLFVGIRPADEIHNGSPPYSLVCEECLEVIAAVEERSGRRGGRTSNRCPSASQRGR